MTERVADYPIDQLFLDRWSPRAFTGEPISERDLFTILEAGRWAASSYNSQPWRFLWARRDTPHWERFLSLLIETNQSWAKDASALIFIASKSTLLPPGKDVEIPSHSHSFDAGAAGACIALQAVRSGWAAHGMVGVRFDDAFATLGLPEGHRVEAAFAIGRRGDKAKLPEPLQAREQPNGRRALAEIAFEGGFSR